MKKLRYVVDDIFLFAGCVLMIIAGTLIAPVVAVYTAAIECFVIAYLYSNAVEKQDESRVGGVYVNTEAD